jgi:hypothetical protein
MMRGCNTDEFAVGGNDSGLGLGYECRKLSMMY